MAIVLGSKLVKDLSENAHVAIGITLPFRRGNNGFFAQSYRTIDQVKSNIKNFDWVNGIKIEKRKLQKKKIQCIIY